jgi:hypothetical protein
MALRPAMSVTACIIVMSVGPTKPATLPEARVETISFGTPTGSARIASVTMAVLPEPPRPSSAPMSLRESR